VFTKYKGYLTESSNSVLAVTMDLMADFQVIIPITSEPRINGDIKDYSFYITPSIPIMVSDTINISIVDPPTSGSIYPLAFNSNITNCVIYDPSNNLFNNTCSVTTTSLLINLSLSLNNTLQYKLVISSVKLSRTQKQSSMFSFISKTGGYNVQSSLVNSLANNAANYVRIFKMILTTPTQLN
jgi:hypothetical protein